MLPVLALIGRPNVGKSTLFNRLTRSREALVADFPGLTRDRQYGLGRLGSRPYLLIDTGGLSGSAQGVESRMEQQVRQAMEEADHLLWLVDGQAGCTAGDLEIAERLRTLGKPVTLVVNKTDHQDPQMAMAEFHQIGWTPQPIAAKQGRGVRSLIESVLAQFPPAEESAATQTDHPGVRVAVVGRPNVGKSTLINRLLGEERLVTYDAPGTTRDSIFIPFSHRGKQYTLIDTAGVRRRARIRDRIEKFSVVKTLQAIDACHVAVLVLDARQGIGEQDATLGGHILERGRALLIALNKWDGLSDDQRQAVREALKRKLGFLDFAPVHRISALHGSGVGLLLETVDQIYARATCDLPTPKLTQLLKTLVQEHAPPLVRGRRIKLRYAHQGGRNPPVIVIHGNQTEALPAAYRRYLINRFREALDLQGTPLRLELRSGENPFADRKSKTGAGSKRRRVRPSR